MLEEFTHKIFKNEKKALIEKLKTVRIDIEKFNKVIENLWLIDKKIVEEKLKNIKGEEFDKSNKNQQILFELKNIKDINNKNKKENQNKFIIKLKINKKNNSINILLDNNTIENILKNKGKQIYM